MRTFTNPGTEPVDIPSLNVRIEPGQTLDVDGFVGSCPDCLTEEKKSAPAKAAPKSEDK
jgi:hypothetical protein